MNKADKRQRSIRNKLMAAVAMLLVASIMTVTTTYAWFTLSTAPEVQGITTTVGANGNLEIALSPLTGEADDITSEMGDGNLEWIRKNLTWGNLLDLSDSSYNLNDIALMPARLNSTGTIDALKLLENPLQTPVYSSDGRVTSLEAETYSGMKYTIDATTGLPVVSDSFVSNDFKGVRAVGTASTMSEYQATLNTARSNLGTEIGNVQTLTKGSLNSNGSVLAEMAIAHATAADPSNDTTDYSEYLTSLRGVINTLKEANNSLEKAIRASLRGLSATTSSTEAQYNGLKSMLEGENTLESIWTAYQALAGSSTDPLSMAYAKWSSIKADLTAAESALAAAEAKAAAGNTVVWNDVSGVMGKVMNTNDNLYINGKALSTFKQTLSTWKAGKDANNDGTVSNEEQTAYDDAADFVSTLFNGISITLGEGTGVYYDFAMCVDDVEGSFKVDVVYAEMDLDLRDLNASMTTMIPSDQTPYLYTVRTGLAGAVAMGGSTESSVIDETYGYIVDFFFRTNATNSKLLLETEGDQRIYTDSANTDTMGKGSNMTFRTGSVEEETLRGLMNSIRVVFFDTTTLDIYGVAKLDTNQLTRTVVTEATEEGAEDIVDISARLKLYSVTSHDNGKFGFGEELSEETAILCDLPTNTAKAISVLVYLDGDAVTNADVASFGTSAVGTLNLQFASDANLVPMTNTELKNSTGSTEDDSNVTKYTVTIQDGNSTALYTTQVDEGASYTYTADGTTIASIDSATMNGQALTITDNTLTIDAVTGDIVVTVTQVTGG